jgi:hypothetical protein
LEDDWLVDDLICFFFIEVFIVPFKKALKLGVGGS